MWGLFERRTKKMGLVRLLKLSSQNIWYIEICSETPLPLFELTQSWGLFEQWKFNFNMFSTLLWFEFKNNVGPYAKNNIYSWILLDKNISFPTSSYRKLFQFFKILFELAPVSPTYLACLYDIVQLLCQLLTISGLNLPLSSPSTTSRELLPQFTTCSG